MEEKNQLGFPNYLLKRYLKIDDWGCPNSLVLSSNGATEFLDKTHFLYIVGKLNKDCISYLN